MSRRAQKKNKKKPKHHVFSKQILEFLPTLGIPVQSCVNVASSGNYHNIKNQFFLQFTATNTENGCTIIAMNLTILCNLYDLILILKISNTYFLLTFCHSWWAYGPQSTAINIHHETDNWYHYLAKKNKHNVYRHDTHVLPRGTNVLHCGISALVSTYLFTSHP